MKTDKIYSALYEAIDELNELLPEEKRLGKSPSTVLFSRAGFTKSGILDSMDLVNLIVTVEEKIQKHFVVEVDLSDEQLFADRISKMHTLEQLAGFIEQKLKEKR